MHDAPKITKLHVTFFSIYQTRKLLPPRALAQNRPAVLINKWLINVCELQERKFYISPTSYHSGSKMKSEFLSISPKRQSANKKNLRLQWEAGCRRWSELSQGLQLELPGSRLWQRERLGGKVPAEFRRSFARVGFETGGLQNWINLV